MEELLKKLSSYNIFNYLLPGIVFVVLAKELFGYSLYVDNLVLGVFYYYFLGLIISRVGSIIIEPILKVLGVVTLLDYQRFVRATSLDAKIDTLSESKNMFRTMAALIVCLSVLKLELWVSARTPNTEVIIFTILLGFLFLLFILGYKKQCDYISKRIIESEIKAKGSMK
jgi:hypothetical protein